MTGPSAETAYLFRHALLREAAYGLQLPSERAKLHELAFQLIEQAFGGRAPEPPPIETKHRSIMTPHSTDPVATTLVYHAEEALKSCIGDSRELASAREQYLRRGAEFAARNYQFASATKLWEQLAKLLARPQSAYAMYYAAGAHRVCGNPSHASRHAKDALEVARESGDVRLQGMANYYLGVIYRETGRFDEAERCYVEAIDQLQRADDGPSAAAPLGELAILKRLQGDPAESKRLFQEALELLKEDGSAEVRAQVLGNLAGLYAQTGDRELAESTCRRAIETQKDVNDLRLIGNTLGNIAMLQRQMGRIEEAEATYRQALDMLRKAGCKREYGITTGNLAFLYMQNKRPQEAERAYEEALAIHEEVGNQQFVGTHGTACALLKLHLGKYKLARKTWLDSFRKLAGLVGSSQLDTTIQNMREACAKAGVPPFE